MTQPAKRRRKREPARRLERKRERRRRPRPRLTLMLKSELKKLYMKENIYVKRSPTDPVHPLPSRVRTNA